MCRAIPGVLSCLAVASTAALLATSCERSGRAADGEPRHRVLILGIDGLDPRLLGELMDSGRMPAFSKVAARGTFLPLETTAPPQSPVAWSSFITGSGAGTHQIYDFIHRDPAPEDPGLGVLPVLSTSTVMRSERDWALTLGRWRIPLSGQSTVSLRQGRAFWEHLIAHGVDTTIYRVPANYPPPEAVGEGRFRCLCGMGTPDVLGSYGEFTLYTPEAPPEGRDVSGGRIERLDLVEDRAVVTLRGPDNFLRTPDERGGRPRLEVELEIVRDPVSPVARISAGAQLILLNRGEWSDWVPLDFETGIPGSAALRALGAPTAVRAAVRFYLRRVHPEIELYVSPLNIDPVDPAQPIGAPAEFSAEVAAACGRYYTTGIPEDTKALRAGALDEDEFLAQVELLKEERLRQYSRALEEFREGCLFFYFGHIDQLSHIFWRDRDPGHPAHRAEEAERYGSVIEDAYLEMDSIVERALAATGEKGTLIVMSDHGFTSFRHGFHLNTWLVRNGYMTLKDPSREAGGDYLENVDWSRTRAYALGLNALYVNLWGREKLGTVRPREKAALLEEIAAGLLGARDDAGARIVDRVYPVAEHYRGADPTVAPDLLVGYADTFRASWATSLGGMGPALLEENHDRWSGDHCIAHQLVPGILVTNRKVAEESPSLVDLAPTILQEFGVETPPEMTGRALFGKEMGPR